MAEVYEDMAETKDAIPPIREAESAMTDEARLAEVRDRHEQNGKGFTPSDEGTWEYIMHTDISFLLSLVRTRSAQESAKDAVVEAAKWVWLNSQSDDPHGAWIARLLNLRDALRALKPATPAG